MIDKIQNGEILPDSLFSQISRILNEARRKAYAVANSAMVRAYWQIGRLIVDAQGGNSKAKYGDNLIANLSKRLTKEFGAGYTQANLRYMRQFYLTFPNCHTLCDNLSWSHYRVLIKVTNSKAREFYAEGDRTYAREFQTTKRVIMPC